MLILGIDPGTGRTGYGVIKWQTDSEKALKHEYLLIDYGCIETSKNETAGKRLYFIQKSLEGLLEQYKPDCMVVEQLFFGVNARTAMVVGQARGVIIAAAAAKDVPVFEYTGLQVKLTVADHGRADKKVVQQKVRRLLKINKRTAKFSAKDGAYDDAADALACALCHVLKNHDQH